MIDWSKPVRLQDGTRLIAHRGPMHTAIALESGPSHPAFPIGRDSGFARTDDGLVISNHAYRVENVPETQIDVIEHTPKDTCHNRRAPFLQLRHDWHETYQEGLFSGLKWGLHGQFYEAGGPGGFHLKNDYRNCPHIERYNQIDDERNANWKNGWREGQRLAQHWSAPDLSKLLQLRKPDGTVEPIKTDQVTLTPQGIRIGTHLFHRNGVPQDRCHDRILENRTMSTALECRRFGIFGQTHTSLFDTLEEVSRHWHDTRTLSRGTKQLNGECIVALRQVRDNGSQPWCTIAVEGPLEPTPDGWEPKLDGRKAEIEGWNIFNDGAAARLERHDDAAIFADDSAAWTYVVGQARKGSGLHKRALEYLKANAPEEYLRILEHGALS